MSKLPGIQSSLPFDPWRIVPYDRTLLYNFKDAVATEEEAIALISDHFETGNIIAARQLHIPISMTPRTRPTAKTTGNTTTTPITIDESPVLSNSNTSRFPLVIEVLFASNELRIEALRREIKYKETTYRPVTTTTDPAKFTIISLSQMALIPENERMASFRHWVNIILMDVKATQISERDILYIWLEKDKAGIYRGSGTVILKGYDERVAELKGNATRAYMNAPNYPNPKCYIQFSYMCCDQCKMLDDHNTVDCTYDFTATQENQISLFSSSQQQQEQEKQQPKENTPSTTTTTEKEPSQLTETTSSPSTAQVEEPSTTPIPKVIPSAVDLDAEVNGNKKRKENDGNGDKDQPKESEENHEEKDQDSNEKSPRRPSKRVRWAPRRL